MVAGGLRPFHGSKGPVQRNCLDPVGAGHPPALAERPGLLPQGAILRHRIPPIPSVQIQPAVEKTKILCQCQRNPHHRGHSHLCGHGQRRHMAHPELFELDRDNIPTAVAGCPPDGFSATGQLWGNPLYRWEYHRSTGYEWWLARLAYCYKLYDVVRIDHFRGFDQYYSIPAAPTLPSEAIGSRDRESASSTPCAAPWEKRKSLPRIWDM